MVVNRIRPASKTQNATIAFLCRLKKLLSSIQGILKNLCHSIHDKAIAYALNGNDLNGRIMFEVIAQLGDINIQVAAVKKGITAPEQVQDIPALYDLVLAEV